MKNSPDLEPLLHDYQLWPRHIKKTGNVYQIDTGSNRFALKEVKKKLRIDLFRLFQWLNSRGYVHHLPLIPDRFGNFIKAFNGKFYYLMPWVQEMTVSEKEKKMFTELARLHLLTFQTVPVTQEAIQQHYNTVKIRWQQEETFLIEFLESCERQKYRSPFEWRYVFYYHELKSAYAFALNCLEVWREEMLETKRARTCLVHGKLHPDHYLIDDRNVGDFVNFEKSRIASPIADILPFFAHRFYTFPEPEGNEFQLLQVYLKIFSLTEAEMLLFQAYLAHPGTIIRIIHDYQQKHRPNHEWEYTKKIERFYWSFKNRERFIRRLTESSENRDGS